jgi:hypothetical protein
VVNYGKIGLALVVVGLGFVLGIVDSPIWASVQYNYSCGPDMANCVPANCISQYKGSWSCATFTAVDHKICVQATNYYCNQGLVKCATAHEYTGNNCTNNNPPDCSTATWIQDEDIYELGCTSGGIIIL